MQWLHENMMQCMHKQLVRNHCGLHGRHRAWVWKKNRHVSRANLGTYPLPSAIAVVACKHDAVHAQTARADVVQDEVQDDEVHAQTARAKAMWVARLAQGLGLEEKQACGSGKFWSLFSAVCNCSGCM
jgi:hypothetical protein